MNEQQLLKEEKEENIVDYKEIENMNVEQVEKYLNKNNEKKEKDFLTTRVFEYLDDNPDSEIKDLRAEFPKANKLTLSKYKSRWKDKNQQDLNKNETNEINEDKKNTNPIIQTIEDLRKYIIKTDPELMDNLELFRELHKFKEKIK